MSEPPNAKTYIVLSEKLQELCNQPQFREKLAKCRAERTVVSQGNPWLDSQEKKSIIRHIDPDTNDEILLEAEYVCIDPNIVPPKPTEVIVLRARIDDAIYELKRL